MFNTGVWLPGPTGWIGRVRAGLDTADADADCPFLLTARTGSPSPISSSRSPSTGCCATPSATSGSSKMKALEAMGERGAGAA
ncbi:hypothetical protein K1Y80_25705 [Streptomyces sp. MAG02]|nr:hypothetical protein [Streptomyces sp. MAG02]